MSNKRLGILKSRYVRLWLVCIALVGLTFVTSSMRAQPGTVPVRSQNADDKIALHQALLDLTNAWTVMCVAAHPDDEDGATLTVLRRKYGVHSVTLFSTFGEGGQNAIGPELYEELGAIRAQETKKASEIQGSEPHFLGLKDFGFSKSAEEAFRVWGHDEALRRMVFEIRNLRPDVIITNHDTTSGHGHHQATGRLVLEAFDAAADPKRFPEQVKEAGVWQVQRLFVRIGSPGGGGPPANVEEDSRAGKIITIDRNELDPVRGISYAHQALLALQQHASQGPWPVSLSKEGWPAIRYRLAREATGTALLSQEPETFLDGLKMPSELGARISELAFGQKLLSPLASQRTRLIELIAAARVTPWESDESTKERGGVRHRLFYERCDAALALLSGISASLKSVDAEVIPNSSARVVLDISNTGTSDATIQSAISDRLKQGKNFALPKIIAPNSTVRITATSWIPPDEQVSVPHSAHLYDGRLLGRQLHATIQIVVDGRTFSLRVATRVDIVPAIEIASITPSPYVLTSKNHTGPLTFKIRLVNHQNKPFTGEIGIASQSEEINKYGDAIALAARETRDLTIRSVVDPFRQQPTIRRVSGRTDNRSHFVFSVHPQKSDYVVAKAVAEILYIDAPVAPGLRVGYVRSFDDSLRNALVALGVESQELSIDDIRTGDLQKFDTIIIDNRGYLAHPELVTANLRLMEFTRNGGTLIVNYHRTNEWNPDAEKGRPSLAPYPITLGNDRVTDENAPVTFTESLHPLLITPNKIGPGDFEDWIQERGLYYPKSWDPRYQALFAMNDSGEEPLRGGLLVADYGRGHYIYTSMVWYRQLRAGVPGGYRMFANMISYGKR